MAASNATAYPVTGQAYRVYGVIKNLTTGGPIVVNGGLTGLVVQVSQDGAEFANSTGTVAEIEPSTGAITGSTPGSGYFYADLTTTDMGSAFAVVVRVSATNTNAIEWQATLLTDGVAQVQNGLATTTQLTSTVPTVSAIWSQADYGDTPGRAATVLGQIAQIWRYLFNQQTVDKNAQTQTLMRDSSTATLVSGTISASSTLTVKGKMS